MLFFNILQQTLLMYTWQDVFEVLIISYIFYHILFILSQDTQKPLLKYFYFYFLLITIAYTYNCSTLQILLLITAPACVTFFILIHQETLQKNFIALYRPAVAVKKDPWHLQLIQFCQKQASKNQSVACIIEKKQNLESLIHVELPCHATFSQQFFDLIYTSPLLLSEQYILFEYNGTVRGLNIKIQSHDILHHHATQEEKELFISAKTDALILTMDNQTLTFTCIHNNKKLSHLSAHTTNTILNTFFEIKIHSKEGAMYANTFDTTRKKTEFS